MLLVSDDLTCINDHFVNYLGQLLHIAFMDILHGQPVPHRMGHRSSSGELENELNE